jgi:hypothetical protein
MVFVITPVASRADIAADPDADAQPWSRIAGDGNALRYRRMRSEGQRSWCAIDQHDKFVRRTQGLSFNGTFAVGQNVLIHSNNRPGVPFRLSFDHPVTGVGLDVQPDPVAIVPGQGFRARLQLSSTATGDVGVVTVDGVVGACAFIGGRCNSNAIDEMVLTVMLLDGAGLEQPVDYAVNRLELLVPVGLIA